MGEEGSDVLELGNILLLYKNGCEKRRGRWLAQGGCRGPGKRSRSLGSAGLGRRRLKNCLSELKYQSWEGAASFYVDMKHLKPFGEESCRFLLHTQGVFC